MTERTNQTNATSRPTQGYAPVNGLELYYEVHGEGRPLILLHGGLGSVSMYSALMPQLASGRQVIGVDLQGHGHTADIDRPFRWEDFADDIAALIRHLGLEQVDLAGYSVGGGTALQTAIRHPELVRRLVLISTPCRRQGWYPEVLAGMAGMNAEAAKMMVGSPMQAAYAQAAPRPEDWTVLVEKTGALLKREYDWCGELAALPMPVMLVVGDADSFPPAHTVEMYGRLGGGKGDAGWDGSGAPKSRLAVLPGTTHYNIFMSPLLAPAITPFLDMPE